MNRLITVLGTLALIVICLYAGLALLDVGLDISRGLWYWMRYDLLPGLVWAIGLGAIIWVIWGLVSRNNRI
ncbi:hypothetical protein [cf. Phormidesmis sp. LEGE 11477]|uniref:hypothetical protein n=1 Tax=cf. Phormidesmis sp. LEGE 11477 TaxID=1828680 RepID=UPI00188142CA|nr:hypothetical protein [cf. Phormidesmis sp. LEGE 11477]MBE9061782.1 hypothetical protein [cf. Phormidesmis sp. LEGE 11477]